MTDVDDLVATTPGTTVLQRAALIHQRPRLRLLIHGDELFWLT